MIDREDIPQIALEWHQANRQPVIATVISTWGSAPRPVGAQMVVSADGEVAGSVSGGCVEGAVIAEAADIRSTGQPKRLDFGVADADAFAVGLSCGGKIAVWAEALGPGFPVEHLAKLVTLRHERTAFEDSVDLQTGKHEIGTLGRDEPQDKTASRMDGEVFRHVHLPPLRLLIVGAVHIAQPLSTMARLAGYDATVIDPREIFGNEKRFPDEHILTDWPDEALGRLKLDARTAMVTLTHDPKLDDPALISALNSEVFYIGSLGSRRTHDKRLQRLHAQGIDEADLARIHGPVGLDIGAKSPAEIAISIMAELTATLRNPS